MAVNAGGLDRLRVTDERLVELTLAIPLTLVAIVGVSWGVDGFYHDDQVLGALYMLGTVVGLALVAAIYHRHFLGLVGGILYLGAVVGDVVVGSSGFDGPLGLPGAVALFVIGSTALLLCRQEFLDSSG